MRPPPRTALHERVTRWYEENARALPWRAPDVSPWAVLVSEVMLQQTPVSRVLPAYEAWLARWPRLEDLAADAPGEAVRQWGRLGYPRRALRLHEAARAVVEHHGGELPADYRALLALPGVGAYTAAAVAAFAFGRRHAVLDTNVRRVLARAISGQAGPTPHLTSAEALRAEALLPDDPADAARWSVAVMELGALVCSARSPRCADCPLNDLCVWRRAGAPAGPAGSRRSQGFAGTDRQVRGLLLAALREAAGPVAGDELQTLWMSEPAQRERALDGLVADGLVEPLPNGHYRLPA